VFFDLPKREVFYWLNERETKSGATLVERRCNYMRENRILSLLNNIPAGHPIPFETMCDIERICEEARTGEETSRFSDQTPRLVDTVATSKFSGFGQLEPEMMEGQVFDTKPNR
jgi:hypothetical protein